MGRNYNKNLQLAQIAKDDEFYTLRQTAEALLNPYWALLEGKRIYSPADTEKSEIVRLLKEHGANITHTSDDYKNHLKEMANYDVIITNPPFSIFQEFLKDIEATGKDYILIAPLVATRYDLVFSLVNSGRIELTRFKGDTTKFLRPDGTHKFVPVMIISTFKTRTQYFEPKAQYSPEKYEHYNKYGCIINVDRLKDIPADYSGLIGAPVTAPAALDPKKWQFVKKIHGPYIGDVKKFDRIIIKNRRFI